jgi:acetyl-CoA carboxylase carboxyl transferase subunit beta
VIRARLTGVDRWATFDCYGTLVDWRGGIGAQLSRLLGGDPDGALLDRYHALEPGIQSDGGLSYREVTARTLAAVAAELGADVPAGERDAIAASLPRWPVFEDVRPALLEARRRGWKLAILSNTDRDLIDASIAAIGVPFELAIVAGEIGSYKPATRHFELFRERTGVARDRHVHVAQSLFHDHDPAARLGIPSIWVNRLGEPPDDRPARTLPGLTGLANTLDELVPSSAWTGEGTPRAGDGGGATPTETSMGAVSAPSRIDVSIEHKRAEPVGPARSHANTCPGCGSHYRDEELSHFLRVCPQCDHHFPVRSRERIEQMVDAGTFVELDAHLRSSDPLGFFDLRPYTERLAEAEVSTGLGDAMVTGGAEIEGERCRLAVMDFAFMGGSMGSVVGEKFARACEAATEHGVPLVSVSASGGARMQEGILALMQLPKTVCAVEDLRDAGGTLISVVAHPTTGGLLASFASLGDVVIAEPGALMSFAGPRVVESVTREKLPDDFGLSESNFRFGHIDAVVRRAELRSTVSQLLRLFGARR